MESTLKVEGRLQVFKNGKKVSDQKNDFTIAGREWVVDQLYLNSTAGSRGAGFIALSTNSADTTVNDTTFPGEITGNGLGRVDVASKEHTENTNIVTFTHEFTATGTIVDIHKAALFESADATRPINVGTLANDQSLVAEDQITIVWTLMVG